MKRVGMPVGFATILLTAILVPAGTSAQAIRPLEEGDRIRVHVRGGSVDGVVTTVDSLVRLQTARGDMTFRPSTDHRIERSLGPRSRLAGFGRGLGYGFLGGAIGGGLIGYMDGDDTGPCFICLTAGEKAFLMGSVAGLALGLTAGVIGAVSPGERWERLDLPSVRAAVSPDAGGGVRITFVAAVP